MKDNTLTKLRWLCFGIGIFLGFFNIYLQEIEYLNWYVYAITSIIMVSSLFFYAVGFIFIDTEKALQNNSNDSRKH